MIPQETSDNHPSSSIIVSSDSVHSNPLTQCTVSSGLSCHTTANSCEKDVLVSTHTGSGKTLAFLAPIAQGLLMEGGGGAFPRAMIVAPGRELASQIVSVARSLFAGTGLSVEMAVDTT